MCFWLHFCCGFCIWWWWWWWRNCITCLVVGFFLVLFGCLGSLKDWETDEILFTVFLMAKIPLQFQDVIIRLIVWLFFVLGFDPSRCMYIADGLILFLSWFSRCSRIQDWFVSFCFWLWVWSSRDFDWLCFDTKDDDDDDDDDDEEEEEEELLILVMYLCRSFLGSFFQNL